MSTKISRLPMTFEEIRIFNLFSYYGEQVFSLPTLDEERRVVLISGRNGFGKTSFINSVKLLFLGTTDEMMAEVVPGAKLRPDAYLLGLPNPQDWSGIFNRQARKEEKTNIHYGVSIRWREVLGCVTAKRYWTLEREKPEEHLHIDTDFDTDFGRKITDIEFASEFLERRLPKNIVPFFFYDGEQVQRIAESNKEGQLRQIERLLDINVIDTLDEYLRKAINAWKHEIQGPEVKAQIKELEGGLEALIGRSELSQVKLGEIEADIEDEDRDIRNLERRSDALRVKSLQREEPHLKKQYSDVECEYETACHKLADTLPVAAPCWATPQLVHEIAEKLAESTSNSTYMYSEEFRQIADVIPEQLFDHPRHSSPPLTDDQKEHYKEKLRKLFAVVEPEEESFFSLKSMDVQKLKTRIDYYHQAQAERQRFVEDLRSISRLRHELADIRVKLDTLENISPEERDKFNQLKQEIDSARKRRDVLVEKRAEIKIIIERISSEINDAKNLIKNKKTDVAKGDRNSRRIERVRQALHLFENYKQQLKESRRAEIEQAVNRRFKLLMTSHKLIASIAVDANFALTYRDAEEQEIGMANLSAGMKQLAAQALLWALSEITTRHVPIIVDTPLARIDRAHQENLLRNYYPYAGEQVIVLPTDSEIDREKYRLLSPHIAGEFRLENTGGEHTTVIANTKMYNLKV
jgi:DNA sulfur modification protein DndD